MSDSEKGIVNTHVENFRVLFEIALMVGQFLNLMWMTIFFPTNYAEWIINFAIFVYVFAEVFGEWNRRRRQ